MAYNLLKFIPGTRNFKIKSADERILFSQFVQERDAKTDKLFRIVFFTQWILAIALAIIFSPRSWVGTESQIHPHVFLAIFWGGVIASLPVFLITKSPGRKENQYVISVAQIFYSILLIHVTGGRVETHFHIFGSLAFLSAYRDFRPILLATLVTLMDHLVRGAFWPESVYGVLSASPLRAFEHAGWVIFEDFFLFTAIQNALEELEETVASQASSARLSRELSERYNLLLNSIGRSMIITQTDTKGTIDYVNQNFVEISGYAKDECIGKNHRLVNSGTHSREFFQKLYQDLYSGKAWKGEIRNQRKDGSFYWVDSTIIPIYMDGELVKFLSIRTDITRQKDLEVQVVQSLKMASLGEMAGGVAHEINTPLAILLMNIEQMEQDVRSNNYTVQDLLTYFSILQTTSLRISNIVRGLRTFARDGKDLPMEMVSIGKLLDDTLLLCQEKFSNHGVELKVNYNNLDPNFLINCNPIQISQVFLNLLNNSFDAISKFDEKWINIELEKSEDAYLFLFTDSGKGIPKYFREKIMEPFFTTKEVGKGTGLGLSISRGIVESHGGKFFIDAECENTRFIVKLPLDIRSLEGQTHSKSITPA